MRTLTDRWRRLATRAPLALTIATLGAGTVVVSACGSGGDAGGGSGSATTAAGGDSGGEPIRIGLATARTGFLGSWDEEQSRAFLLGIDEINRAGGIDGRQVETEWIDTKTDRATSAVVGRELLDRGAQVLMVTCDFDYGGPAAIEANRRRVVAFSSCAGDPKFADKRTIGEYAFTMAAGSDVEGTDGAEFAYGDKGWRRAYMLTNQVLEYTKSDAKYFDARYRQLGGTVVGADSYTGGDNVDVSAQITRMRQHLSDVDVIVLADLLPTAGTVIRAIRGAGIDTPILHPGVSVYGPLLTKTAGDVRDFYSLPYACVIDCSGGDESKLNAFYRAYEAEYGTPQTAAHPIMGYDLSRLLKVAIERAGTTDGDELVEALETMPAVDLLSGATRFSATCHKPVGRPLTAIEYDGSGRARFVSDVNAAEVPDIGDGNTCAGEQ